MLQEEEESISKKISLSDDDNKQDLINDNESVKIIDNKKEKNEKKEEKIKSSDLVHRISVKSKGSIGKIKKLKKWKNKEKKKIEEEEEEIKTKEYFLKQNLNSFRDISKKMFKEVNNDTNEDEESVKETNHISLSHMIQYKYIVFVHFMQGFLTGLTTAQALSTYLFSSLETFIEGYQVIAVPAHATFFVLFTLSSVLALENFRPKERKIISFIYELFTLKVDSWAIFIWLLGSIINLSLLRFDEKIADMSIVLLKDSKNIDELMVWRILGCIRASLSAIGWFLTMKQDKQQILIPLVEKDSDEEKEKI
uniref:Transmembrane protein n=1 Tax=Parastrongyloides trichosuri TaxID=131310 RepID=A0A0N4ZB56_PARTI